MDTEQQQTRLHILDDVGVAALIVFKCVHGNGWGVGWEGEAVPKLERREKIKKKKGSTRF